jgi:hypothetical protein
VDLIDASCQWCHQRDNGIAIQGGRNATAPSNAVIAIRTDLLQPVPFVLPFKPTLSFENILQIKKRAM